MKLFYLMPSLDYIWILLLGLFFSLIKWDGMGWNSTLPTEWFLLILCTKISKASYLHKNIVHVFIKIVQLYRTSNTGEKSRRWVKLGPNLLYEYFLQLKKMLFKKERNNKMLIAVFHILFEHSFSFFPGYGKLIALFSVSAATIKTSVSFLKQSFYTTTILSKVFCGCH